MHHADVQAMTERLRKGLVAKTPPVSLAGEVEVDEVYVVAGHKGQPAAVAPGATARENNALTQHSPPETSVESQMCLCQPLPGGFVVRHCRDDGGG